MARVQVQASAFARRVVSGELMIEIVADDGRSEVSCAVDAELVATARERTQIERRERPVDGARRRLRAHEACEGGPAVDGRRDFAASLLLVGRESRFELALVLMGRPVMTVIICWAKQGKRCYYNE